MVLILRRSGHNRRSTHVGRNPGRALIAFILFLLFMVLVVDNLYGFSLGDFRSVMTGDWSDHQIWEYYDGSEWISTDQVPQSENTVYIGRNGSGHTVTVDISNAEAAKIILTSPTTINSQTILVIDEGNSLEVFGSIENSEGNPATSSLVRITVKGSLRADTIDLAAKVHNNQARRVLLYVWSLPAELVVGSLTMSSDTSSSFHARAALYIYGRIVIKDDEGLTFVGQNTERHLYDNCEVVYAGDGNQLINTIGNIENLRDYYNLIISGTGSKILQGSITVNNDLTLTDGHIDFAHNQITVNGTLAVLGGTYSNDVLTVDGYENSDTNISVSATGNVIENLSVTTTTAELYPLRINRQWTLSGSFTGEKEVTFFWSAEEDNHYNWHAESRPAVFHNNVIQDTNQWNEVNPRQISVSSNGFGNNRGEWTIGHEDSETLPVELSSFTAVVNAEKQVVITWTVQVETNMLGYNIFRNTSNSLTGAKKITNAIVPARNNSFAERYRFVDDIGEEAAKIYYYWLQSIELDLTSEYHGPVILELDNYDEGQEQLVVESFTSLQAAFPNPFNVDTAIPFFLVEPNEVSASIYNIKGELITILVTQTQFPKGVNYLHWNGKNSMGREVKSGVYFIKMETSCGYVGVGKILLLK